jgi:hypothetical protein
MDPNRTSSLTVVSPDAASQRRRSTRFAVLVSVCAILALCLWVGLPTVFPRQYFLGDDFGLVRHLHRVPLQRLLSYFGSDWTEGIYGMPLDELRPLLAFSYRLDAGLWGETNSAGYHLTNVFLHALNALVVCAIALSVAPANRWIGLIAATLFAIMPCQAEPISWISGRVDSLAALFYLGAFLCFVRFRSRQSYAYYCGALLLFSVGLFAKQSVVTFPILLLAYDLVSGRLSRFTPLLPFFGVLVLYLGLRRALFGSALREDSLKISMFTDFVRRQAFYVKRLLPVWVDYSRPVKAAIGLFLLAIFVVLVWWLLMQRSRYVHVLRPLLFFGPAWYAITVSPMIVTYASARHLYITSAGLSVAAALLILPDAVNGVKRRIAIFGCLLVLYGAAITRSMRPWIENGLYSARISSELQASMRSIPPGSTVLMAIPAMRHKVYFLDFALPFALQAPFTGEDLYSRFSIIEPTEVYCCPPQQWWAKLRPVLLSLTPGRPVFVVTADPGTGALVVSQRAIAGTVLKERIEKALSRMIDGPDFEMSRGDAARVSQVLFPELEAPP